MVLIKKPEFGKKYEFIHGSGIIGSCDTIIKVQETSHLFYRTIIEENLAFV